MASRGGGFNIYDTKTNRLFKVKDLDTVCENLKILFDHQEKENQALKESLTNIQNEKWKDEELLNMKEQVDKAYKNLWRGFPISEEEEKDIKSYMERHPHKAFSYTFTHTSLGVVGECTCEICKRNVIYKLADSKKENFLEDYYKEMEKCEGFYEFQSI